MCGNMLNAVSMVNAVNVVNMVSASGHVVAAWDVVPTVMAFLRPRQSRMKEIRAQGLV